MGRQGRAMNAKGELKLCQRNAEGEAWGCEAGFVGEKGGVEGCKAKAMGWEGVDGVVHDG
jgi:hypothetical protein